MFMAESANEKQPSACKVEMNSAQVFLPQPVMIDDDIVVYPHFLQTIRTRQVQFLRPHSVVVFGSKPPQTVQRLATEIDA